MIFAFTAGPVAVVVALAVFIGHLLTPSRSHRAAHAERQAADWAARLRPHLPRAGCLPLDTDLPADPWDLAAPARTPDPDPCDTGEFAALLARGRVTPAQEAARLTTPEATP